MLLLRKPRDVGADLFFMRVASVGKDAANSAVTCTS